MADAKTAEKQESDEARQEAGAGSEAEGPAPRGEPDPGLIEEFSREELHGFLKEMLLYRRFEEKAEEAYAIGKVGGFCHLHIGQEAVALGCIRALGDDDYVITAYREHTQAIAKGVDPKRVMAELYGKKSGTSHGKGGSMHLFGIEEGFLGGHAIVGGHIPLAAGMGWTVKYRDEDRVVLCLLGDAAVNQGAFHEALNMAAVWELPVVFVVENNEYGMGTAFRRVSATDVVQRACAYDIPASQVYGQDVLQVYTHMREVVGEVRGGGGPRFVEAQTYRFKGHSMSDPVSGTYRSKEEVEERKERDDPIKVLRNHLMDADLLSQDELEAMDGEVRKVVDEAAEFAEQAPDPGPEDLYTHVYAEENEHGRLFFDGRDRGDRSAGDGG